MAAYVPADAMTPSEYVIQDAPTDLKNFGRMEVMVAEVLHPGDFWMRLHSYDRDLSLAHLMNVMEDFYNRKLFHTVYKMSDHHLQHHQFCVVQHSNTRYYRAYILAAGTDELQVKYIDYGKTCNIAKHNIYFMRKQFAILPMQAARARLAHLKPVGQSDDTWPVEATQRFAELVSGKRLTAIFCAVDKINIVEVNLVDQDHIHISETLMDGGYAYYSREKKNTPAVIGNRQNPSGSSCIEIRDCNLLHVKGLPKHTTQQDLQSLFSLHGKVISSNIQIIDCFSDVVGFIQYGHRYEAERAICIMNGSILMGSNEPLSVKFADITWQLLEAYHTPQGRRFGSHVFNPTGFFSYTTLPGELLVNLIPPSHGNDGTGWCIFVDNLTPKTEDIFLWKLFGPFGAVQSAKVIKDPGRDICKGYGFVIMTNYVEAKTAIKCLNGYIHDNHVLQVSFKTKKYSHFTG